MLTSSLLVLAAVLSVVAFIAGCGQTNTKHDPTDMTPQHRTDRVLYGYFGQMPDGKQLPETSDHVSVVMAVHWWGRTRQLRDAAEAARLGKGVIWDLDVSTEPEIREVFDQLAAAGALQNVVSFYIQDEPELNNVTADQLRAKNAIVRRLMKEFFVNAALQVTYSSSPNRPAIDDFDWVGFDHYGTNIFEFEYNQFKKSLKPNQRIVLFPGGADVWREDPMPFYKVSQADPQVVLILAFIWMDNADVANGARAGIRSNGMYQAYREIGLLLK